MITILTILHTPSDEACIKQILLKASYRMVASKPTYGSYVKSLQYDADLVIMEVPIDLKAHLHFLKLVRNSPGIRQKPFILLGPSFDPKIIEVIKQYGANAYLPKPLDTNMLLEAIRGNIKKNLSEKPASIDRNQLEEEELQKMYDPMIPPERKIEILKQHVTRLLAFPATVATELFRIANSVYFSRGGNKRILDIKEAIVRIGFIQTKNIAMGLSVFKISANRQYETGFNHIEFWFHSLSTAIIASQIAKTSGLVNQDEAFISGLLHDMGVLIFNEYFNRLFLALIERATADGARFIDCQKSIIGFDHNDLMTQLFRDWNFPVSICEDSAFFCKPETLTADFLADRPLPVIVNIADIIAKSLQIGREADCCVYSVPAEIFTKLRMHYGVQKSFIESVYASVNLFNASLKMDPRCYPVKSRNSDYTGKINLLCVSFNNEPFSPVVEYLKVQGYNVTVATDLDTLATEAPNHHAFLFTDANTAVMGDVGRLSEESGGMPFSAGTGLDATGQKTKAKMLVFDQKNDIDTSISKENMIVSKYPVDLRNIDLVLGGLLSDTLPESPLNTAGTLKPVKSGKVVIGRLETNPVLIVHSSKEVRSALVQLTQRDGISIEETSDGSVAINLARTMKQELRLLIIGLPIANGPAEEVIKTIMSLPFHRRLKVIVVMKAMPEKRIIVALIQLGVRHFIIELELLEKIPVALQELLPC